ncbi:MAG: sodium/solute symporter [Sedimentisphaerales bacterium]|nr:sodium/solute symporter [Sedimentisphaerales bacterium]
MGPKTTSPSTRGKSKQRQIWQFLFILAVTGIAGMACGAKGDMAVWSHLADLPDPLGLGGHFAGIHKDALLIAGGANFAEPIWESTKSWHNDVYVFPLSQSEQDTNDWITGLHLPVPRAYGASVSTSDGIVCIGGTDGQRTCAEVYLLQWDPEQQTIHIDPLPSLPKPCAYTTAAEIDKVIYVAGGTEGLGLETAMRNFWRLDLTLYQKDPSYNWEQLLPWPGPSRAYNITVSQHDGRHECVYVLSGRRTNTDNTPNDAVDFLTDMYAFTPVLYEPDKYDPATETYSGLSSPWRRCSDVPRCVMAGTAVGVGQSHILVLGGADGTLFSKADELRDAHPGFPAEALAYNTITDTWFSAGKIPANHVTSVAIQRESGASGQEILIPSGEIRPRKRSAAVWRITPQIGQTRFGFLNSLILLGYLAVLLAIGFYFSFRNRNTDDYFRGGQRIHWFVAGMSVFATMLSSITFLAIPAKAYATNWEFFLVNMMAVVVAPFVIVFFLPFFRRIDATSAYEYLEKRFNRASRLFAGASFLLFQIGRMAIVMYLPALALSTILPLSEVQCILIMGVLSLIYCTLGGLRAVVWTDTIQTFILLGGAVMSLILIVGRIEGGFAAIVETAADHGKLRMVRWDWTTASFATSALWVVVLGGIAQSLVPYSSDMAIVQRYMSVSDERRARKAIWTNAITVVPASILFFGLGTSLYVFYRNHPEQLNPFHKTDAIFPLFIANELPSGLSGLVVAGIFAAAQSTVSTSMNSSSTAFMTDFVSSFVPALGEQDRLRLARLVTLLFGSFGVSLALLFAYSDIKSLWDQFMTILGLLGGSMCGLFCLGIFTRRAHGTGAILGAITGTVVLYLVQRFTKVHFLLYAVIGIGACFMAGYVLSLLIPSRNRTNREMTIYDLPSSS